MLSIKSFSLTILLFSTTVVGTFSSSGYPYDIDPTRDVELYSCVSCRDILDSYLDNSSSDICHRLPGSCERLGSSNINEFVSRYASSGSQQRAAEIYNTCQLLSQCPSEPEYPEQLAAVALAPLDLRISKAYGAKGYGQVRITAISNASLNSAFFNYSAPFKYRWTNKHVQTVVKSVTPGKNTFNIDGTSVTITVPAENAGVRGIVIADPCFSGQWVGCSYATKYETFARTTTLINSFMQSDELAFYGILGDNFYDREGALTQSWFNALSERTKSKFLVTVPGNHDFWVHGNPAGEAADQFGNGFMQFYGQDVASSQSTGFLDFSINPDGASSKGQLPKASNFFFYNKIGNVAFIGFSGGHTLTATKPYFEEACAWLGAQSEKPAMALLVGHWNSGGMGCEADMTVPAAFNEIKVLPGCAAMGTRLKYLMGHTHCNEVTQADTGFMLAGQGMSGCGNFGVPVVDTLTHPGRLLLMYFPINDDSGLNQYTVVNDCVSQKGYTACLGFAKTFLNVSIA